MEHPLDQGGSGLGHRAWSQSRGAYGILKGVLQGGHLTHPLSHGALGAWLSTQSLCGREVWSQLLGCLTQSLHASPESSIRGQFSTHSLTLFSWVARDSLGSSGAWGSLSNKTGLQI